MFRFLYRVLCGFFLGLSVFAPGISGSIIALMMGVYHDLLDILAHPLKNPRRNAIYLLPLALGVIVSAGAFVIVFRFLFATFEKATYFFLLGLIFGSIPVIYREVKHYGLKLSGVVAVALSFVTTFVLSIAVVGSATPLADTTVVLRIPTMIYSGLATGSSLLIPGLSASVVLILLGAYRDLLFAAEALLRGDTAQLLPFGIFVLCVAVALVLTSRLIKAAFERRARLAYALVFGFMLGSLGGIATNSLRIADPSFSWPVGVLTFVAGTAVSLFFVWTSTRSKAVAEPATESAAESTAETAAKTMASNDGSN
ncbi:MAG: DUF368 domain-containing protein [Coriobacteriia bacterium]|nr:DUF368 domain-containing protein [Coriobacteriia bacterium]